MLSIAMWSLIKGLIALAVLGLAAYGAFFVDMGGKPLSQHVADVWKSPVMQEKVALVKGGVQDEIERKLQEAQMQPSKRQASRALDQITEEDRRSLRDLLNAQ